MDIQQVLYSSTEPMDFNKETFEEHKKRQSGDIADITMMWQSRLTIEYVNPRKFSAKEALEDIALLAKNYGNRILVQGMVPDLGTVHIIMDKDRVKQHIGIEAKVPGRIHDRSQKKRFKQYFDRIEIPRIEEGSLYFKGFISSFINTDNGKVPYFIGKVKVYDEFNDQFIKLVNTAYQKLCEAQVLPERIMENMRESTFVHPTKPSPHLTLRIHENQQPYHIAYSFSPEWK